VRAQSNVPESVQAADTDKASKLAGELATIEEAMAAFTKLKLEEAQGGEANGVPEGADEGPPTSEGAVLRVNVASCNIKKIDLKAYGIDTAICQVCDLCFIHYYENPPEGILRADEGPYS
jgi:hypothetical protein